MRENAVAFTATIILTLAAVALGLYAGTTDSATRTTPIQSIPAWADSGH
jgi:hypothetical protein